MPVSSPPPRKLALIAGVFWIVTFVASIPALFLYAPVLNHVHYVLGAGADTRIAVARSWRSSSPSPASAPR